MEFISDDQLKEITAITKAAYLELGMRLFGGLSESGFLGVESVWQCMFYGEIETYLVVRVDQIEFGNDSKILGDTDDEMQSALKRAVKQVLNRDDMECLMEWG